MYGVPHRPDVSQTLEMKEHLKMIFQNYLPLSAYREFKWNKNLYLQILYAPKPFKWKSHKKKPLHICFSKETGHSTSSFSFLRKQFISDTNMAYLIAHTHPQTPPPPTTIPSSTCSGAPNLEPNSTIHKTKIKVNKIRAVLNIAVYVAWRGPCPIISSLRSFPVILQMYKTRGR